MVGVGGKYAGDLNGVAERLATAALMKEEHRPDWRNLFLWKHQKRLNREPE